MFAVIKTGGKQYRVTPNDVLEIEKIDAGAGEVVELNDVLMVGGEGAPEIGTPLVAGATVAAQVVEQTRGPKITVFKKKRRKNYKRTAGHRQDLTVIKITEILTGGKKPAKAKAAAKDDKPKAAPKAKAEDKPKAAAKPKADEKSAALFKAPAGEADDLKKISGVGPALEKKLHALGITTFAQIAAFSAEDIAKVDDALSFKGRIERDDWLGQAKALAEGK